MSSRARPGPPGEPRAAGLLRMLNVGYGNLVAATRVIARGWASGTRSGVRFAACIAAR